MICPLGKNVFLFGIFFQSLPARVGIRFTLTGLIHLRGLEICSVSLSTGSIHLEV